MFRPVVEEPVTTTPDGRRILQCHSRGDRRYSSIRLLSGRGGHVH